MLENAIFKIGLDVFTILLLSSVKVFNVKDVMVIKITLSNNISAGINKCKSPISQTMSDYS